MYTIDWKKTKEFNEEPETAKEARLVAKRGLYTVVIIDSDGEPVYWVPAYAAPETLSVLNA
jgi:hypothetical protein